jgi:DNA-binding NarL/FixJ family response regulator
VLGYLNKPKPDLSKNVFDELTWREDEIFELLAQGKTNSEIASSLNLSPKMVSNHISNVLLKVQPPTGPN